MTNIVVRERETELLQPSRRRRAAASCVDDELGVEAAGAVVVADCHAADTPLDAISSSKQTDGLTLHDAHVVLCQNALAGHLLEQGPSDTEPFSARLAAGPPAERREAGSDLEDVEQLGAAFDGLFHEAGQQFAHHPSAEHTDAMHVRALRNAAPRPSPGLCHVIAVDHRDVGEGLAQGDRRREAGETATDDDSMGPGHPSVQSAGPQSRFAQIAYGVHVGGMTAPRRPSARAPADECSRIAREGVA